VASLEPDHSLLAGQSPEARAAFLKLREAFLAGLSQRRAEIETASSDLLRMQALHRLAGAAGSYGFTELGQAARAAEQALALQSATSNSMAFQVAWSRLKQCMGQEIDTL
jgi:HPt (histidine-containing phosphotransfer) domain-containing protein